MIEIQGRPPINMPVEHRQIAILQFIAWREKAGLNRPSVREIGEAVGLTSSSTTHGHLQDLHRRGVIDWEPKVSRSVRLRRRPEDACPACGGTGRRAEVQT